MKPEPHTVLIMAGGTGGHVFPAMALAKKLQEQGYSVHWLGTQAGIEARVIPEAGIPISYIPIHGLRGKGLGRWLTMPFKLLKAVYCAMSVIRKVKPQLVVGLGGFVSGPGAIAAKLSRLPLVIHEQNAIAGMTNRYLSKIADRVLCAFPGAFPASAKVIITGNPIREEILKLGQQQRPPLTIAMSVQGERIGNFQPLRLLIIGGSLGAAVFNEVLPAALGLMPPDQRPEVWHQAGEKTFKLAEENYAKQQVKAKVVAFIKNMAEAYEWADVVLCRAGAMTVSELAVAGKPAILVPLPYAVDDHQRYNAKYLADQDAAVLKLQSDCNAAALAELLGYYSNNRQEVYQMAQTAKKLARPDATDAVMKACIDLMEKHK